MGGGLRAAACRAWPGTRPASGRCAARWKRCARLGIQALTLYAFSVENWKRPRAEVETLWRLLRFYLRKELPELQKNDIRLQAIGRLHELPPDVRRELDAVVDATAANRGLLVQPGDQLRRPHRNRRRGQSHDRPGPAGRPAGFACESDEDLIAAHLVHRFLPPPDLLIRTSGEMRLSNFLLWQIAYAELYVTETLWPDFSRTHLSDGGIGIPEARPPLWRLERNPAARGAARRTLKK